MEQSMIVRGPSADAPLETMELVERRTEAPGGVTQGQHGLSLLLQAAWKASEEGRETMRDILHELELRGAKSAELLESFDQRSKDMLDAAEEQSWQACDRLELVVEGQAKAAQGLHLVAAELRETAARSSRRFDADRTASQRASRALLETQRRLIEQFELNQRHAATEFERLGEAVETERRGRLRRTVVATVAAVGLLVSSLAFVSNTLFPTPQPESAHSVQQEAAPAVAPTRPERTATTLPAGMPRLDSD